LVVGSGYIVARLMQGRISYWQKVSALKEKLDLLSRLPEPAIERAARTLLDLRESSEWATR